MAEHIIDKFEYNSEVYKFQDNVSGYAPLTSPVFTGTPTAPTATSGDSSTQIATTAFVQDAMSGAGAGTVTSVGVSNDTYGGLSVSGSPITSSGTITIGHSNVLSSAQTTEAVYPIKIDKNGHISEYGNAVTVPSITLNGSSTTSPSFYAPTSVGTSGYVLKSNGSGAPSWASAELTDKKLEVSEIETNIAYYPIVGTGTTAATRQYDTSGFEYCKINNDSSYGRSILTLGNNISQGTTNNKRGALRLYGTANKYTQLETNITSTGAGQNTGVIVYFPDKSGTVALADDIPDVSGKIDTAGTGLSKSGTTLNHSNSVTAQTTQAVYPIKIDAQGHISAYGSAVSVPTKVSELQNDSGFIVSPNVVYCTCSTASGTAAKVATIESGSLTSLNKGDQAIVKFTNANGKANPTLKIGNTEAKSIMRYGTTAPSTSAASSWNAGSCVLFTYDGTYWQMIGYLNTTYSEISQANITDESGTSTGLITGRRAKAAVEAFAPVKDVTVGGTSVMSGTTAVVPAIPTVNDATLTIQKNGTNVATFTANASSNVTANISVPTDTGDLTNGAGYITSAGGTSTPTANTVAKFDSSAHMNSTDMTSTEVNNFVSRLNTQGINLADYVVATGVDGIWTYRKWASGLYDAWYIGSVNLLAGTAWGSGFYWHQSSSALTPPSFSQSVSSLVGAPRAAQLTMFCGVATDYSQYWATASSGTGTIPVRLDMQGRWK